jgi:hypothetical protein
LEVKESPNNFVALPGHLPHNKFCRHLDRTKGDLRDKREYGSISDLAIRFFNAWFFIERDLKRISFADVESELVQTSAGLAKLIKEVDDHLVGWWGMIEKNLGIIYEIEDCLVDEKSKYPFRVDAVKQEWKAAQHQWKDFQDTV